VTTILLDRDRFYGSALARAVARRQPHDEIALIVEADALHRLLARDPSALVIVDEGAVDDPSVLRELISGWPSSRFVVLVSSMRSSSLAYLQDGAAAIVPRGQALDSLGPAVAAVDNGLCVVPPPLMRTLLGHLQLHEQVEDNERRLARLSPRELEILELLVRRREPAQVAEELDLSIHTVRSHLKRIFRKLEVHSTLGAVLVAVAAGLVPIDLVEHAERPAPVR